MEYLLLLGVGIYTAYILRSNGVAQSNSKTGSAAVVVPAQSAPSDDLAYMSRTLYGEARGESDSGVAAVAQVIMNRVQNSRYPNTVKGVVLQAMQFSVWNDGGSSLMWLDEGNAQYARMLRIGRDVMEGRAVNTIGNALHYANLNTVAGYYGGTIPSTHWIATATGQKQIGNHTFLFGVA